MTQFVDVKIMTALVNGYGLETFLEKLVHFIEEDFFDWQSFDKSPRSAAHSELGVIELMPVANDRQYSFKYVNGHPDNSTYQLPTVMAFGVLADVKTGYPLLLSELTLATAIRTAAASIVAAKMLARPDSSSMALIGNGCQSEFQAIAFHSLLGINKIYCYDVDPHASMKLAHNLAKYQNLELVICDSVNEAVEFADIITTVTADKKLATIITEDMVKPGVHINGVGGDCPGKTELAKDVLLNAEIFVEFESQSRIEGDIQQLSADHKVVELWQVLTGRAHGRTNGQQITVFDSVGFALEDFSTLRLIFQLVEDFRINNEIELIPTFMDPKDLFSLLV